MLTFTTGRSSFKKLCCFIWSTCLLTAFSQISIFVLYCSCYHYSAVIIKVIFYISMRKIVYIMVSSFIALLMVYFSFHGVNFLIYIISFVYVGLQTFLRHGIFCLRIFQISVFLSISLSLLRDNFGRFEISYC